MFHLQREEGFEDLIWQSHMPISDLGSGPAHPLSNFSSYKSVHGGLVPMECKLSSPSEVHMSI